MRKSKIAGNLEVAIGKAVMVWVKLPCTYTQEDLTVNSNEVATVDKIKRWGDDDLTII